MLIPSRKLGEWAQALIDACYVTQRDRIERGAQYRNLYLTGAMSGERQVYNLTYKHIDKLSSWLFSPVELRFAIEPEGQPSPAELAMARRASGALNGRIRRGKVASACAEANTWALVKGLCLVKLLWDGSAKRFMPQIVQPEMFGVLREDINDLDRQEAFVHSTWYTPDMLRERIKGYPGAAQILRDVGKYVQTDRQSDTGTAMDLILPGPNAAGLFPYQAAGEGGTTARAQANWLTAPRPTLDARVRDQLLRWDELWVRDDERDDWTTLSLIGDVMIDGEDRHRNLLGDPFNPDDPRRKLPEPVDNPLHGHHPFIPFCPNRLDGYFWGLSEVELLAALQGQLNSRVDGIGKMLRLQENPPRAFLGSTQNEKKLSILSKPGGYLTDSNPNTKIQSMAPEIPSTLWESLHELVEMFRTMGGFTPTMQGLGDQGVRSNAQAEALIAVGSPEIKDRALLVEEAVEEVGGLAFDILRVKDDTQYHVWLMPDAESVVASIAANDEVGLEAPAKGMKRVPFTLKMVSEDNAVRVDSHSSSPAFAHETQQLMFALAKIGAASPEDVVSRVHPPNEEGLIAGIERRAVAQAQFLQQHPEIAAKASGQRRRG
jgi:hypothetical protein